MLNNIKRFFISILVCIGLLAVFSTQTHAQAPVGVFSLADLGVSQIRLVGPYDSSSVTFGLPASWKVNSSAQISLNIPTTFNTLALQSGQTSGGGVLTVSFNRNIVAVLLLSQVEAKEYIIDIPVEYLVSPRSDGRMELRFQLDSSDSCYSNQQMNVLIGSDSRISFSYDEILPDTNLANFPRPIYQNSILPDFAYVVIPDEPSSGELQGALSVASGLGSLTSSGLTLDLLRVGELTAEQKAASHLIFVGKVSSIPQISELNLPSPVAIEQFQLTNPDNGIVQMVNSPWSQPSVILVVSGNTDLGVAKAANAVSTGYFVTNNAPNLAIVEDVQSVNPASSLISDQSFADMGFGPVQFTQHGVASNSYTFFVPSGSTVTSDAYFELAYGHSALLNYNLSGMVVLLNGKPIGSVLFTAETSRQTINSMRVTLPPSLIIPGKNSIELRASLEPIDLCVDPNSRSLWAVIWPESRLYLPFTPALFNLTEGVDLSLYPAPMVFNDRLNDTAFVFSRSDPETWRLGLQVASYLGDRANGPISQFRVFFDDETDVENLTPYHLIVIGRPSHLTIIEKLADVMPVSFEKDTDIASNKFSEIVFQIPNDVPIGYLELFQSPWNSDKVVITALGNTPQGQEWAASSLYDTKLLSQLAGNFAVINDTRVQTVDTRFAIPENTAQIAPNQTEQFATPSAAIDITPIVNRPGWILPALQVTAVLTLIFITVVVLVTRRRAR